MLNGTAIPRWEVKLVDHDAVTTVVDRDAKVELEIQYSIKLAASTGAVAERLARNLLKLRHPETAKHNVTARARQIYQSPPR